MKKWRLFSLLGLAALGTLAYAASDYRLGYDKVTVGNSTDSNKELRFNIGSGSANPGIRGNDATAKVEFSHDGSVWTEIGSTSGGSGGVGVNLMVLDTAANAWAVTKSTNANAETTVGDWLAYADAAATSPVDMTGGAPNSTIARITSGQLNGTGSFQLALNSGASRQGEGVSVVVNIPVGYRGKLLKFKFPFTTTGTILTGEYKLFAYDITNTAVLTPKQESEIIGSDGVAYASFQVPSTTVQIRLGIHIARTATGAATITFDDVLMGIDTVAPVGARSTVRVVQGNGYGSTNTFIRRFATVDLNQGTDITYADSATLGASFTINTPGAYSACFTDAKAGANAQAGISLNTTEPSTGISVLTNSSEILASGCTGNTSAIVICCANWISNAGDVIRPHTSSLANDDGNFRTVRFQITKMEN